MALFMLSDYYPALWKSMIIFCIASGAEVPYRSSNTFLSAPECIIVYYVLIGAWNWHFRKCVNTRTLNIAARKNMRSCIPDYILKLPCSSCFLHFFISISFLLLLALRGVCAEKLSLMTEYFTDWYVSTCVHTMHIAVMLHIPPLLS